MNPEKKFNSYVILITTAFMFLLWILIADLISQYKILSVFLGGLISAGTYRSVYLLLHTIFLKNKRAKQFILGSSYMEGTWIGFFIGNEDKVRFYIENFEQDLSTLVIRGKSFDENGKFHGSWISETTNLNSKRGKLTYYYESDVVENTFINPGLASFDTNRRAANSSPKSMIGFSSDLFNAKKLKAYEEKIDDNKVFSDTHMLNIELTVKKAREIYEKNVKHI